MVAVFSSVNPAIITTAGGVSLTFAGSGFNGLGIVNCSIAYGGNIPATVVSDSSITVALPESFTNSSGTALSTRFLNVGGTTVAECFLITVTAASTQIDKATLIDLIQFEIKDSQKQFTNRISAKLDQVMEAVLRKHSWSWAMRTISPDLTPAGDPPRIILPSQFYELLDNGVIPVVTAATAGMLGGGGRVVHDSWAVSVQEWPYYRTAQDGGVFGRFPLEPFYNRVAVSPSNALHFFHASSHAYRINYKALLPLSLWPTKFINVLCSEVAARMTLVLEGQDLTASQTEFSMAAADLQSLIEADTRSDTSETRVFSRAEKRIHRFGKVANTLPAVIVIAEPAPLAKAANGIITGNVRIAASASVISAAADPRVGTIQALTAQTFADALIWDFEGGNGFRYSDPTGTPVDTSITGYAEGVPNSYSWKYYTTGGLDVAAAIAGRGSQQAMANYNQVYARENKGAARPNCRVETGPIIAYVKLISSGSWTKIQEWATTGAAFAEDFYLNEATGADAITGLPYNVISLRSGIGQAQPSSSYSDPGAATGRTYNDGGTTRPIGYNYHGFGNRVSVNFSDVNAIVCYQRMRCVGSDNAYFPYIAMVGMDSWASLTSAYDGFVTHGGMSGGRFKLVEPTWTWHTCYVGSLANRLTVPSPV